GYHAIQGDRPAAPLLVAANRWAEDESGISPLKKHFTQLTACVPLELDASGLVVFTQDWHVSRKLSEDAAMIEHEMIVEVTGDMIPHALKRMNQGIPYNGRTPTAIKVSWQNETRLRVALKGAQIGQIAHLCEAVGLQMVSMKRIRLGGVSLGKVPSGQWRYLRMDERF
ncbi:MAG: RNA-binding protein, partial [Thiobacillus sp.]|nr:RNA-binding protein [Thiobacillus sp.]